MDIDFKINTRLTTHYNAHSWPAIEHFILQKFNKPSQTELYGDQPFFDADQTSFLKIQICNADGFVHKAICLFCYWNLSFRKSDILSE